MLCISATLFYFIWYLNYNWSSLLLETAYITILIVYLSYSVEKL